MLTLLSSLLSFLAGGVPKIFEFMQDRADKKHELQMAQMQTERELQMLERGYAAQAKIEEIRTDQIALQTAVQEREALYNHDIVIGQGASQWVINARAFTRSFITYGMFILFAFVEFFGFFFAYHREVPFDQALNLLWDDETQLIWSSVVAFWFGTQAFKK